MNRIAPVQLEETPLYNKSFSDPSRDLSRALHRGDLELARSLLSATPQDYTSVCVSENYSWKGGVDELYRTVSCSYSQDLLVIAAKAGDETTVRAVLSSHSVDTLDTALWFSCRCDHGLVAELLLERGASLAFSLFGVPCVHLIAFHSSLSRLSRFIDKQSDLLQLQIPSGTVVLDLQTAGTPVKFRKGALPCHMCAVGPAPSLPLLELLLPPDTGVDPVDNKGRTPLIYACKTGNALSVRTLLDKRANIEHVSLTGKRSILYAARRGDSEVIELLVRRQASLQTTDRLNRGVFFYARDEGVASDILECVTRCRREALHSILPICELATQGYTQTIHSFLDSLVSSPSEDRVQLNLEPLDSVPTDGDRNETLLSLFCELDPALPLYDSLVLRGYVDHHMLHYGYVYLSGMILELLLYLTALSVALLLGVKTVDSKRVVTPLEWFRLVCEVYVVLRWLLHLTFEVVELVITFKNKIVALDRRKYKIFSFNPAKNSFVISSFSAVKEYITDTNNSVDYLLLWNAFVYVCLRITSLFVGVNNTTTVFAVLVYFLSFLLLLRHIIVIPVIGTYLQTVYEALKDSILFLIVFFIPLFQFTGMLYLSYLAPPTDPNLFNTSGKYDSVRERFDGEYYWLLLNGVRLLVEQGAIIKFNYLEVYNWLMVIVFMSFAFLTVLVMRSLFVGRISSNYKRINQQALRYTTYRTLRFLRRLQTKSVYSLSVLKYILTNSKQINLKRSQVRYRHLSEFNRLFSNRKRERDYVKDLEKSVSELRRELRERMDYQDRKLEEMVRSIKQLIRHN